MVNIQAPTVASMRITHYTQTDLENIAGSVPDHLNKANIATQQVTPFFNFPMHIKVMFALYFSLLSMQIIMSKKTMYFLNLKILY